ncbi:MAG: adenylate/guanylate cyclase domain-containing protein [Treponema sp.]|nr:adenylate/guanylate cyclase domain-containing protein [Treponema sp.]
MAVIKQFFKDNAVLALFFLSAIGVLMLSINANINLRLTVGIMEQSTQEYLLASSIALSEYVSIEDLDKYHTEEDIRGPDGEFLPEYKALKDRLVEFAEKYGVLYAYFWRPLGDGINAQYIIDNDYSEDMCTPDYVVEIDFLGQSVMQGKPSATDLEEYTEGFTGLISGVAPIYDAEGNFYCGAGVDISDERIITQRNATQQRYILQTISIIITIITSVTLFMLYMQKIKLLNVFNTHLKEMVEEETQKVLALHETFGRFLSDEIVKDLLESPDGLALGGKKQDISIIIADIRGFSLVSEQMHVEDVVTMLNHYFSVMVDIINKYNGTVIEFLGDGILAIFGAPVAYENHPDNAIACAMEMQIAMEEANRWNVRNNFSELEIGIGINSGETIVGNIGSPKSMKYNVIGNNVNMASRIETYSTGSQVLISGSTLNAVKAELHVVQTMEVFPKGAKTAIQVYQIDSIGAPYNIELKSIDKSFTKLEEPLPIDCYWINEKHVAQDHYQYYMISVSEDKAIIIAGKDEPLLEIYENIRLVNPKGFEVFAKVIRKPNEGIVIVRFTSSAKDFVDNSI